MNLNGVNLHLNKRGDAILLRYKLIKNQNSTKG